MRVGRQEVKDESRMERILLKDIKRKGNLSM